MPSDPEQPDRVSKGLPNPRGTNEQSRESGSASPVSSLGGGRWDPMFLFMETGPTCIRVIDLETGGNGPDDVCEIGWQDLRPGTDNV